MPRFWFNPEIESRRFLIPGAIAIVMTMIGTLLTALVVAREWERGTMEAIMSTPASILEILIGKLLPYFGLGLIATLGLRGGLGAAVRRAVARLLARAARAERAFLVPALGQGLLISALARNQFVAAQIALISGFLPALLLSGFLFEIDSMPLVIRALTHIVAGALLRRVAAERVSGRRRLVAVPAEHARDARDRRRVLHDHGAQDAQEPRPMITRLVAQIVKELLSLLRDPRSRFDAGRAAARCSCSFSRLRRRSM